MEIKLNEKEIKQAIVNYIAQKHGIKNKPCIVKLEQKRKFWYSDIFHDHFTFFFEAKVEVNDK